MTQTWTERVREKAAELHLSDASIGRAIGVSKTTVCSWMRGHREAKLEQKRQVAELLGVSLHWLETGEEEPNPYVIPYIKPDLNANQLDTFLAQKAALQEDTGIRLMESIGTSYLLRVNNDSMIDPGNGTRLGIPPGSTVQIDSDTPPEPGNFILIQQGETLMLRVWQPIESSLHLLTVINPLYQSDLNIKYQGNLKDIFKGTVVAFCRELR
ncbi:helix-turn-helix domain-containing protein [Endozoicomonas atrinae]|uniref:helix-turn-helix domain-containing protein n=1 Tax=Endozoicomonas atrinae TaxID=1333660 RepID=UPI0008267221|nr:helix-turn-helix domain-containing protein [Endozoicomonas atrinae]